MKTLAVSLLFLLMLAGCDPKQAVMSESKAHVGIGKFVVIAAGHTDLKNHDRESVLFSAWRLDTETGDLQFCTYDSGGTVVSNTIMPESLTCVDQTTNKPTSGTH